MKFLSSVFLQGLLFSILSSPLFSVRAFAEEPSEKAESIQPCGEQTENSLSTSANLPCPDVFKTETRTDAKNRSYEYVPGDPFKTRVYHLKNGLTLYLSKCDTEPRIKVFTAVRAGSADESEKSTGLAHYFEHMMFKGNDKIGALNWEKEKPLLDRIADLYEQHRAEKDPEKRKELYAEIDRLSAEASQYSNNEYWTLNNMMGGSGTNAWTSFDETVYMTDIPSNQLERFLTLEAERFSSIALRRFHTELETVYEEFNLGQDSDSRSAYFALLKLLYGSHPYGRPVIGYPEHLKAPSMKDIQAFFREYYNPCNMALILCGDLDFEQTVDLVEKTFGKLQNQEGAVCTKNTSRRPQASEGMPVLTQMETAAEIFGPEPEFLYIGFRLDPTPRNKVLMRVLSAVLLNGKCGILDEDLLRPQKVQDAGSFPQVQRDSIYHVFQVSPKEGQSLEEAKDLLLAELQKVAQGDFDPDGILLEAVGNNMKKDMEFSAENRGNIVDMVSNFIEGISIADALNQTECAGHITREMLSDFVRENYQNYAIVYKRNGEPKHKVKAEKPHITPVSIPSELSSYAKEIAAMPVLPDPDPVFTDFSKGISGERLYGDREKSVLVYSFKNTQNNRFKLSFYFPFGTLNEKKLELALGYLRYLGTDSLLANDLSLAEYAKALSFDFSVSENSACLSISGLQQNFKDALPLFCGLILHAQNDPEAYRGFAEACCKNLSDQKKDPSSIQNAAVARALYGSPDNYFTHRLSRDEILQTNPQELTDLIHELPFYLHDIVYYGPAESVLSDLQEGLAPLYANTDPVKSFPEAVHYTIVPPEENQIYLVNYPSASNATVMLLRPDEICNPPLLAFSALYNAYAQQSAMRELREKQGLGYVASQGYICPHITLDNYSFAMGYISTQPDKLRTALDGLIQLMDRLPMDESFFDAAKDKILRQCRTSKLKEEDRYFVWRTLQRLGLNRESREIIYEELPSIDSGKFLNLSAEHTAGKPQIILIIQDLSTIQEKDLDGLGTIHYLDLDEIFKDSPSSAKTVPSSGISPTPGETARDAQNALYRYDENAIAEFFDEALAAELLDSIRNMPPSVKKEMANTFSHFQVKLLSETLSENGTEAEVRLEITDEAGRVSVQTLHLKKIDSQWKVVQ